MSKDLESTLQSPRVLYDRAADTLSCQAGPAGPSRFFRIGHDVEVHVDVNDPGRLVSFLIGDFSKVFPGLEPIWREFLGDALVTTLDALAAVGPLETGWGSSGPVSREEKLVERQVTAYDETALRAKRLELLRSSRTALMPELAISLDWLDEAQAPESNVYGIDRAREGRLRSAGRTMAQRVRVAIDAARLRSSTSPSLVRHDDIRHGSPVVLTLTVPELPQWGIAEQVQLRASQVSGEAHTTLELVFELGPNAGRVAVGVASHGQTSEDRRTATVSDHVVFEGVVIGPRGIVLEFENVEPSAP